MGKGLFSCSFFLLFSIVLLAQQPSLNQTDKNGKKQGKWIKKDEYGKPVYEGTFKDGKPVGEFRYFYDTGELKTLSVFSTDGSTCRSKHYFPGNILMAEGKYVNEKRDSIWKFYNAPNALISVESYKKGKKDGPEKNYGVNGLLSEEKTWKDSVLNGPFKSYYDDGTPKTEGVYNSGVFEGEMKYYYPGKVLSTVGHFQHALKHGQWIYYDRRGLVVIAKENYKLEKLEGDYAEYYEKDGQKKVKGKYKDGREDGKWTYWDKKGILEKEANYSIGGFHGLYTEYFDTGKKKIEGSYYYGAKTGTWTEWDEEGKIVKEEKFDTVDAVKKKITAKQKEKKEKK